MADRIYKIIDLRHEITLFMYKTADGRWAGQVLNGETLLDTIVGRKSPKDVEEIAYKRGYCPDRFEFEQPHGGITLRKEVLDPLKLTPVEFANELGLPLETVMRVLNGELPISDEFALKLEEAGFKEAPYWWQVQAEYEFSRHP